MGHKDKGRAGLRPRFLEEQPLPAKEGERENTSLLSSYSLNPLNCIMKAYV